MNPSIYVGKNWMSRNSAVYQLKRMLITRHAKTCRCGSNQLKIENSVSFIRLTCLVCGNKTETFSKHNDQYQYGSFKFRELENERLMRLAVEAWNRGEYKDWQDDYEYHCVKGPLAGKWRVPRIKSQKFYLDQLRKENEDVRSWYYDQMGMNGISIPGFHIGSAWLPHGLNQMDQWYGLRIRELGSPNARFSYTPKQLERAIKKNLHLHAGIKANLLDNLKYLSN